YGWQRDGANAEYMIADEKDLIVLPDELSFKDGCFISCGVGTAYEGILRGGISGSDTVLVVGLGPVGMAAGMLAKGKGARLVIGVDVQEDRRKTAESHGFVDMAIPADGEALGKIRELTRGGATRTIDCSGNPHGRHLALQATHEWGRAVYLGETGHVQFDVSDELLHKQRTLIGSWVTSLANMEECTYDLVAWGLHPDKIVTHTFPLSKAPEAFELMSAGGCGKVVIDPELG
ncbi:MAG: zinc-binding dehydrogenase, partial [Spirochaetales bacterium]|nr:zinc-binding dehydrogenase [Spirochaetales bacterium]